MSDTPPQREPLLSGWMKFLLVVALLFLVGVGVVSLLGRISTNRWHRYAAELRAGGDPLTFEEIEAQRATVSEEQNGARVIERLASQLEKVILAPTEKKLRESLLVFGDSKARYDFFKGIPKSKIEPSREFLERHRDTLNALSVLRNKARGRFHMPSDQTIFTPIFPHNLSNVRTASRLFILDATIRLIDGQIESAANTAILLLHLAGTLHDEPSAIALLRQRGIESLALQTIEYALRVGELNVDTLIKLGNEIDDRLVCSTFKWASLGERAGLVGVCDELAGGNKALNKMVPTGLGMFDAYPLVVIRMNQLRIAEVCTWLVDACDDPSAITAAAQRTDTAMPNTRVSNFLVRMLLPTFSTIVRLHLETMANLRCARAGLAAEQFRSDNGRLPVSLEALVPRYLAAVPTDPFGKQPIRLAANENGVVIYSVGPNRTDDGGDVTTFERGKGRPDTGFRLLKPHFRGLVILDDSTEAD